MTVIRRRVTRNFSAISNDAANDNRLGGEHLGLLYYLLTKPHNWTVQIPALSRRMHWGRDKTYRVVNSLVDFGYIERSQGRERRTGTFERVEYIVFDEPVAKPRPERKEAVPFTDYPLPEISKAAKIESKESPKIIPPTSHAHCGDKLQIGSAMEVRPRSSNAARPYVSDRQQGHLELQIAQLLGENGWDILSALTEEELLSVFRWYRSGELDQIKLIELQLKHQAARATPQKLAGPQEAQDP